MWVRSRGQRLERRMASRGYVHLTRMDAHGFCNIAHTDMLGRIDKEGAMGKDDVGATVSGRDQMEKAECALAKRNSGTGESTGSASRGRGGREDARVYMHSRHPPLLWKRTNVCVSAHGFTRDSGEVYS